MNELEKWIKIVEGEFSDYPEVTVIDREETIDKPEPPRRYLVYLHNDDYSPAEFVAYLLMRHFRLSGDAAWNAMLDVHRKGKGVLGAFPKDVAETKAQLATQEANAEGYPTLFTAEAE